MSSDDLDLKIMKIHRLSENSRTKAFVDLGINDAILIKGLRIVNGQKGLFVSMPREQGKDEKWYDKVHCLNKETRSLIEKTVLEAFKNEID